MKITPNRVVALLSALITLALGLLPIVADADWSSTAGIIAAVIAILGITNKWLEGWQKWENGGPR